MNKCNGHQWAVETKVSMGIVPFLRLEHSLLDVFDWIFDSWFDQSMPILTMMLTHCTLSNAILLALESELHPGLFFKEGHLLSAPRFPFVSECCFLGSFWSLFDRLLDKLVIKSFENCAELWNQETFIGGFFLGFRPNGCLVGNDWFLNNCSLNQHHWLWNCKSEYSVQECHGKFGACQRFAPQ